MDGLLKYCVRFFDPQPVAPDGGFRLRIVDFEPMSRTVVKLDQLFPALQKGYSGSGLKIMGYRLDLVLF